MASGGMDSFLGGMKRAHMTLAPKTCREKKNIRISEADPFVSQHAGLKQTSPIIHEINISPLSTKTAGLNNSASLRRLEIKPSPTKDSSMVGCYSAGPFESELHNLMRDLQKVYGKAMRREGAKDKCDHELEVSCECNLANLVENQNRL